MWRKFILYIAGAYSNDPDGNVRELASTFYKAADMGWVPILPHAYKSVDDVKCRDSEFWYDITMSMCLKSDAVYCENRPIDTRSDGTINEIRRSLKAGIPVFIARRSGGFTRGEFPDAIFVDDLPSPFLLVAHENKMGA